MFQGSVVNCFKGGGRFRLSGFIGGAEPKLLQLEALCTEKGLLSFRKEHVQPDLGQHEMTRICQ